VQGPLTCLRLQASAYAGTVLYALQLRGKIALDGGPGRALAADRKNSPAPDVFEQKRPGGVRRYRSQDESKDSR
jgi:hypothetical protein